MHAKNLGLVAVLTLLATLLAPVSVPLALADGTPDLVLSKDMPDDVLLGENIPVSLTLTNPSGPDGFNSSFNDVLPVGVSYVPGSANPDPLVLGQADGTTVLVWSNVADMLTGATVRLDYEIVADASYDAGDTVTNSANAYANSDPRILPRFDPVTGEATEGFTGFDAASDTTELLPFELTKTESSDEDELLRGLHDHQTVYTLTIENNLINPSSNFSIVDYLPAGLEFLGCGAVDNSTVGDEYLSSGPINPGNEPPLANPCLTPSSVTTVTADPDGPGPLPNDVYTRVEWDTATLGTSLAAGGAFSMDYIAAIPLFENVDIPLADPTANIDNNTGAITTESESELRNYAVTTGTYNTDTTPSTDEDYETVVAEDISIHKEVDNEEFVQGDTPVWTLVVETSEYALSTGPISVTDTLPNSLDFTGATPAADSAVVQPDGTTLITWTLPPYSAPSSSTTITINSQVREFDRLGDGSNGTPVSANDDHTNTTNLTADVTVGTDSNLTPVTIPLDDESSASQFSTGPTIEKEVSVPIAGGLTCGDGSGVTFDPIVGATYRPGDRVCWRLSIDFPSQLDTLSPLVQDFLPAGFEFESWEAGAGSALPASAMTFTDLAPQLTWALTDQDVGAVHVEIVVSTIINDPGAAVPGDLLSNLMKFSYVNEDGEVFQLRDQADAEFSEAILDLDKGVIELNGTPVAGAPADGVSVQEDDVVTYQLDVSNIGTEPAFDATVRDILPPGITCADVSAISDGGSCDAANDWIDWDASSNLDIAAGGNALVTYDVTVPFGTSAGSSLVNTAGVRTYGGETNTGTPFTYVPENNIDPSLTPNTEPADDVSEIITELPTVDKIVTTSVDEAGNARANQATIGETASYTITVELPAGLTYFDASISDLIPADKDLDVSSVTATLDGAALPAGFTLVADDAANSITIDFPTPYSIPNGPPQVIVIEFDAVVTDDVANVRGAISSNSAALDYENAAGTPRNVSDSVELEIVEPNIVLDKANDDIDGVVVAGQTLTYTLSVTNDLSAGDVSVAHDTEVVDTIPSELIVLEAPGDPAEDGDIIAPDGGVWDASARTITWAISALDPGATTNLTYQTETENPLVAAGSLTNTAEATTTSLAGPSPLERSDASLNGDEDGDGYQDSAESTVTVPLFDLTKTVDPTEATVGDPLTYTLEIAIPAGVIGYDVTVLDDLPVGIAFESLTSVTCDQGGACSPDISTGDASVVEGGGDVAFFFGDLTTAAAGDRTITITYVAVVEDLAAADDGSNLENSAAVYWNAEDLIPGTPVTPPDSTSFDTSSTPSLADVDTVEPTLTIDKDVSGQVADADERRAIPGETLTYTLTIANTGTSPAYNAVVSDIPTDVTWAFTDTTTAAGVTNTDANPAGGLGWTIDGPIAPGASVTITYELVVPLGYDSSQENPTGPEQSNVADIDSYFGVDEATRAANPGRDYREYDDVVADTVDIELDLASIGDYLWFDVNGDGVQDASEPPIANVDVIVTYLGPDGLPGGGDDEVFVATTDANGLYVVEDLPGGEYLVEVDESDPDFLTGLAPSYDLDGTTAAPNGTWTGSLGEDEDKRDVDFGYTGTGSIGDTIWFDQNLDGVIDPNEAGIEGVDVTVTWLGPDGVPGGGDDVVYTATTDADGQYLVENLPPGEFTVEVDTSTLPSGYSNVSDPGGENDDASSLTLAIGEDNLDQDFGYAGSGSIGDTIWLDQNNDGVEDPTEPGIGGVTVQLTHFGPDGVPGGDDDSVFTTITDADGQYLFENLPPGDYEVAVLGGLPTNALNTFDPDSAAPGDSVSNLTLGLDEDNRDQDFGYHAGSVLGDRVWWDLNNDGVQDPGEPGLNGVEVTATFLGPDGIPGTVDDEVFVTTTTGDGDYLFTDVPDGDYAVAVTSGVAPGLAPTFDEDSGTVGPDESTELTLATEHLTADFGYVGDGAIGDTIWFDTNQDGLQTPDEFGLEGITVDLTWLGPDGVPGGGDDITLTTMTDADGNYIFEGLPAGEYVVEVDESTLPAGIAPTYDADDGTAAADSSSALTLAAGEENLDQDFGYAGSGSIGDTIWLDIDGDGVIDPDEAGIGAVTVTLTWDGPFGPELFTTVTDANGNYLFENLPAGDFTVTVDTTTLPAGLAQTFDQDGGFDDSSAVTLAEGEANLDQDFGYRGDADVGDTIWLDLNGDGIIDPDEPGIANQTVELTWQSPTGPVVFTTTTDSNGNYLFPNLPDGDYTITVVGGIVDTAGNTGDPGGDGDSTNDLTISGGVDNLDQDFGYQGLNAIGDEVWVDYNLDGVIDADEPGIAGVEVTVTWFGPDGVPGGGDDIVLPPQVTDADGNYAFTGLPDGSYSVEVTNGLPAGIDTPTYDADSGTTTPDSTSIVTDLGVGSDEGVTDNDQDFGFIGAGSIGDTIWLSLDGNDTQDADEPGVAGITVNLTGAGPDGILGTPDDVVYPSQVTDANGMYLFENLPPGPYEVTYDVNDLDAGIDPFGDLDGGELAVAEITLGADEENLDVDFVVEGDAALEGSIWVDADGDGVQDPDELPLEGVVVVVTWEGPNGPVVLTTMTDADGNWELPNLPPGSYTVSVDESTVPSGYLETIPVTTELVIPPGGLGVVENAFAAPSSIGDFIWEDLDRDGVVDPGENGIEGIVVNLLDPEGNVVATTTTDVAGNYVFDDLLPGTYTVSLDPSSFPTDMSIVFGPDGNLDSLATIELSSGEDVGTIDFGLDLPDIPPPAGPLALTGRTTSGAVLASLLMLLVGAVLIFGVRRRRPEVA